MLHQMKRPQDDMPFTSWKQTGFSVKPNRIDLKNHLRISEKDQNQIIESG